MYTYYYSCHSPYSYDESTVYQKNPSCVFPFTWAGDQQYDCISVAKNNEYCKDSMNEWQLCYNLDNSLFGGSNVSIPVEELRAMEEEYYIYNGDSALMSALMAADIAYENEDLGIVNENENEMLQPEPIISDTYSSSSSTASSSSNYIPNNNNAAAYSTPSYNNDIDNNDSDSDNDTTPTVTMGVSDVAYDTYTPTTPTTTPSTYGASDSDSIQRMQVDGSLCVFPMEYEDSIHFDCISYLDGYWCVNGDGNWGQCA